MKLTNLLKNLVSAEKTPQTTAAKPAAPAVAKAKVSGGGDKFEGGAKRAGGAPPPPPPTPEPTRDEQYANAVRQLDKHFDLLDTAAGKGKKDGKISEKDLKAALDNPTLPAELREACRFLMDNKESFKQLDLGAGKGRSDGIISKKDVAAQLAKLPATTQASTPSEIAYKANWDNAIQQLTTHFELVDTAAKGGKPDGKISENDLKAAMNNKALPQELRDACRFLVENKAARNQLDVAAGKGKVDGIISRKDVGAVLMTQAHKTGFGTEVDKLAALSPTLQADLKQLEKEGWTIEFGKKGGGSYCSRSTKTITIDSAKKGDASAIVATMAHEVGHALYNVQSDTSSREAYVKSMLAGEGAAELKRLQVRSEIQSFGGPNIKSDTRFDKIYKQYLSDGDVDKAREAIGEIFRGLKTSNTKETYEDYYGGWYDRNYGK